MREQESGSSRTKVQVRHLTKKFGDLLVLDDISFDVEKGDLLCVVGPTGCGKTTFLNSLTRMTSPPAKYCWTGIRLTLKRTILPIFSREILLCHG